ncbi:MAG: ATP-binding protein [Ilumatobacteraceae bacterium]
MFDKWKIRTRLAVVVLVPAIALTALAGVGYRTLYSAKIGSRSYDRIVDAKDLLTDVAPSDLSLTDSYATVLALATETDGPTIAVEEQRLVDQQQRFDAARARWNSVIVGGTALDQELQSGVYPTADRFFDAVSSQFLPAVERGDPAAAQSVISSEIAPVFEEHRAAIDRMVPLAEEQVGLVENFADDLVARRTWQLLAALAAIALVVIVVSAVVARSIIQPVRQLISSASRAEAELPGIVDAVQHGQPPTAIEPISVASGGELGALATAMNGMQSTAVQLASEQAQTRRNVSTMLANLARRNQSLLNRTLSFISQLEENERDPQTLQNLFKLDHLATRMRRNAESLLVLAGSDTPRTWPRPIEASEIVRASLSEIEDYDRVDLTQVDQTWIRGSIVSDLVHLLAELLDNATRFSPPETKVTVVGKSTENGYILSVIDQGMGMTSEQLAQANRELDAVSRPEERTSLVLGLAVVGRLAARSGVQVRLSESPFEGVTAQVRVPHQLLQTPSVEPQRPAAVPSAPPSPTSPTSPAPALAAPAAPDPVAAAQQAVAAATARAGLRPIAPAPAPTSAPAAAPPPPPPAAARSFAPPAGHPDQLPPPPPTTRSGLAVRVPGAQLFESGGHGDVPPPPVERTPESIRDALSSFQHGFERGPAAAAADRGVRDPSNVGEDR